MERSSLPKHPSKGVRKATFKEETMADAVKLGLWVRLEAKPGKETEVEDFLRGGLSLVQQEPATVAWFALRLGKSTFGIFDAFPDESGRQAHLSGRVASALKEKASELFAQPPAIEKIDVLAAKLPQQQAHKVA
jgi:quinol monooxygenase YgiN